MYCRVFAIAVSVTKHKFLLWDDSSAANWRTCLFNTPAVDDFVGAPWRNLAYTPQPWSVLNGANHCKALKSEISYVSHYLPNPKLYAYWRPELCKSLCRYSCWCSERLELSYLSTSSWYQLAHCFIGAISGRSVEFRRILICIQILDWLTMWNFMRNAGCARDAGFRTSWSRGFAASAASTATAYHHQHPVGSCTAIHNQAGSVNIWEKFGLQASHDRIQNQKIQNH